MLILSKLKCQIPILYHGHHLDNLIPKDVRDMIYKPWITSLNVENRKKEKRTLEEEIYKVVPNKEFVYKHNDKIDSRNAFLFEE